RLPVQLQGTPQQIQRLVLPVEDHVGVGQVVRGLRLSLAVPDLAPDHESLLEVGDAFGLTGKPERLAQVVQHPRLARATRCVAMQFAQLPRRLNMVNSGAGRRQATSSRPNPAAWRVAATRLARSLSYQASASSTSAKASGAESAAGSSGML